MGEKQTLAQARPDLATQWHPTKNGTLTPQDVTPGSGKKVWWQCSVDSRHEWDASVDNRVKGRRCPLCSGRKVLAGLNDLATLEPRVSEEWHPTKNGALTPDQVRPGSAKKVWWQCEQGHEWQASITNRTSKGHGCPACYGRVARVGESDLATVNPELAAQWHPTKNGSLTPTDVTRASNRRVWWQCTQGHEWEAPVSSRTAGHGCSYCSGRFAAVGETDLATTHPEIAAMWHPTKNGDLTPRDVKIRSEVSAWWQCEQGHEWEQRVSARTSSRCPYCVGARVIPGETDLATTHPEVAAQWHPTKNGDLAPQDVKSGSSAMRVHWVCDLGHEWTATPYDRVASKYGCPQCAGTRVFPGVNDLATTHPEIAKEWDIEANDVSPSDVKPGSERMVAWKCSSGHKWSARIITRVRGKQQCPYCSGRLVIPGETDLATTHPAVAALWHPNKNGDLTPQDVRSSTRQKVWWKGECGHEWDTPIATQSKKAVGKECPYCNKTRLLKGFNDLATTRPDVAAQWHPTKNGTLTASDVMSGSSIRAWWICEKGHEWRAMTYSRANCGCPTCAASIYVSVHENDVLSVLRELLPGAEIRQSERSIMYKRTGKRGELDIYLPEYEVAVEFNGVYWHSEVHKGRDYHAEKRRLSDEAGIELYQIWEDDWRDRRSIVIRGLAHRLGVTHRLRHVLPDLPDYYTQNVGARRCQVVTVSADEARAFLNENHIQGFASGSYYFGLRDAQERLRALLVAKRSNQPGAYYIERYATAGTVQGGFTRLLRHAERHVPGLRQWVTFADLSLSNGALYRDNGFIVDKVLEPDYTYLVQGSRVHKFNYRLKRFREDPDLMWEEGLSERELAALNGLHRVWDAGKVRWVKAL